MKHFVLLLILCPYAVFASTNPIGKLFTKSDKVVLTEEMKTIAADLPWTPFITKGTDMSSTKSDHYTGNAFDVRMVGARGLFKIRKGTIVPRTTNLRKFNNWDFQAWRDQYGVKVILIEAPKEMLLNKKIITGDEILSILAEHLDKKYHKFMMVNPNATGIHFHFAKWDKFEEVDLSEEELPLDDVADNPAMILNRSHSTPSDDPHFIEDPFVDETPIQPVKKPSPVEVATKEVLHRKDTTYTETIIDKDSIEYIAEITVKWGKEDFTKDFSQYFEPKQTHTTVKDASLWNICLDFVNKRAKKLYGSEATDTLLKSKRAAWISSAMMGYQNQSVPRHQALAAITLGTTITNTDILDQIENFLDFGHNGEAIKKLILDHSDFGTVFLTKLFEGSAITAHEEERLVTNALTR